MPPLRREEKAEPHRDEILHQYAKCEGNLARVHEELEGQGVQISYPGLTAFCRRHGITAPPTKVVGEYHFEPGSEMQHDTSPHKASIGGKLEKVQTAAQVLAYSRMLFFQHYPTFNRFYCKVFLTEAALYIGGVCAECMIDNTHVVVLSGTGPQMVVVPEMEAFGKRLGFVFRAHRVGDPDRKARVERAFHHIENNFLVGRTFADHDDLNRQAREFCDKVNARIKRHLHASPRELFAVEQPRLRPLPIHVPEVYQLHQRIVDVSGYVTLHAHRYSAPLNLIGRQLEVRETKDSVEIYQGPRQVARHRRVLAGAPTKVTAPQHRPPRGQGLTAQRPDSTADERLLQASSEEMAAYVRALKQRLGGLQATLALRRLASFLRDYPQDAVLDAVKTAAHFGLFDMQRLERMVLRAIGNEYFVISPEDPDEEEGE